MPPKKKSSRNGFMQFALEYKERSGKKFLNNQELTEAAAKKWNLMSAEEREPYHQMNKLTRNNLAKGKCTSDGVEVDLIERELQEKQLREEQMKIDIDETVTTAAACDSLKEQIFFLLHINHLCYYEAKKRHYLSEIAVVPFNLKGGIFENLTFHRIIKPGKLPLGYYHEAMLHSKETHQLFDVVYDDPPENSNEEEVYEDMVEFIKSNYAGKGFPPLYTDCKRIELSERVMQTWKEDFNHNINIKIYNIQYLFYKLRNAVSDGRVWPTETFSYMELEKDIYSHNLTLACEYHKMIEHPVYCSLAITKRSAFVICDNCCLDLDIELVPGRHIPPIPTKLDQKFSNVTTITTKVDKLDKNEEKHNDFTPDDLAESFKNAFPSLGARKKDVPTAIKYNPFYFDAKDKSYSGALDPKFSDCDSESCSGVSVGDSCDTKSQDDFPALGQKKFHRRRPRQ